MINSVEPAIKWAEQPSLLPVTAALHWDINKCFSSVITHQRYISNSTSAQSVGVMSPDIATKAHVAQKILEGMAALNPVVIDLVLAVLVGKGPKPESQC
jgi:hypothetical protein